MASDAMPVPDRSTARADVLLIHQHVVQPTDERAKGGTYVCKQTKSNHETSEEQEIHRPVKEARSERQEEEESEENADCGDDFGVDEALLVPC